MPTHISESGAVSKLGLQNGDFALDNAILLLRPIVFAIQYSIRIRKTVWCTRLLDENLAKIGLKQNNANWHRGFRSQGTLDCGRQGHFA